MSYGSLQDARESLTSISAEGIPLLEGLVSASLVLLERLAESLASKETAMATLQFSLLELEVAQDEIRKNEARYRELFSSMNDGVAVFEAVEGGESFIFRDINASSLRIERLERRTTIGRKLTEVLPSAGDVGLLDVLRRVYESGNPVYLSPCFYHDSRIKGWREYFIYKLPTEELVLVYRDVSKEKAAEKALRSALASTEKLIDSAPIGLVVVGADETIRRVNAVASEILAAEPAHLVGQRWDRFRKDVRRSSGRSTPPEESCVVNFEGDSISVLVSEIPVTVGDEEMIHIEAFLDLTDRKRLETQLRHAQKLEAVGQLAAGIAHEINTPAQFIGDNLSFLSGAFESLSRMVTAYRASIGVLTASGESPEVARKIRETEAAADLKFIEEQVPAALQDAREGISRISTIVSAMKQFGHPDHGEKSQADLNHALRATLEIARNEYKHVAEVETDFGDLPPVACYVGDLNQVFLNLLVNAAHAIADSPGRNGNMGRIRLHTGRAGDDHVRIDIRDTGCGIPREIQERVFDPFFTTKEVGRGTGQGLAIARSIVVDKHHGSLTFDSEVGKGTTFTIILPVNGMAAARTGD
ncbi:MAG: ATP-binding protein [Acidobacteriota bacterium]